MFLTGRLMRNLLKRWRRGRDLNSRTPCEVSGFQDRHVRPLRHPSIPCLLDPEAFTFLLPTGETPPNILSNHACPDLEHTNLWLTGGFFIVVS